VLEAVNAVSEGTPPRLRSELLKTTNSADSATILIADRRGRKELGRAVRRISGNTRPSPETPRRWLRAAAAALLLLVLVILSVLAFR